MVSAASIKHKAANTRDQLRQLRDQIEELMGEQVTPKLANAAGRAETTYRAASGGVQDGARKLSARVRDKPLTAIAIATAAGFLLGRLSR